MILAISRGKDSKASPPYLSRYRLSKAPFSSLVEGDAFFTDPDRTQTLDMLQHLTQYSEELLLVTGPDGVGKSCLLEQFLTRAEEHWQVCRLDGGHSIEAESLFKHIAECFSLDLSRVPPQELLQRLQAQLNELQEQQLPVLLIDDAQRLSDDALEIVMHLAALEGEHGKLVRVLLFSDNRIDSRLASERFSGVAQPHRLELKALDEHQTAAYLEHRLRVAGYQGAALFSDKEVRQVQRQARGLPGIINDAAHDALMLRMSSQGGASASSGSRYLKMGLAATAIIGSVLGLHERINGLLGGDERAMSVSSPERPVMRLADQGNPWAVAIRDGESIQINCGAFSGETVGVRPVLSAAAMVEQPLGLSAPMLEDVSPAPVVEESATPPGQTSGQAPIEEAAGPGAPTGDAARELAPSPEVQPPQPPLVVKQEAPAGNAVVAGAETEAAKSAAPKVPAELKLLGTTPSPLIGSNESQRIVLNGSGFVEGSKVAVSHGGKVEVLPDEAARYLDEGRIAISVNTGILPANWAAQVSTPDNRRSNVLRFQVAAPAPPKPEAGAAADGEVTEPLNTEPVKPKVTSPQATATAQPAPRATPSAVKKGTPVLGSDWLAGQPKQNFTLQLLASNSREATEGLAGEAGLAGPLAHFAMDKDGKELHVLTQGSYASRAQAEQAAKSLPKSITPWIRRMESVQQVMKREPDPMARGQGPLPPSGAGIKDTAWVWSQDPGRYTVQLAAAESETAIEAAMRRITLPGELVVVQTLREGRPWFALIYGSFASKASARGTIDRLPEPLKRVGPWPRSFASLHDEISRSTPGGNANPLKSR